ncbi:hypothetical protein ACFWED_33755, partial [Streptomyces anulatus]
TDPAAMAARVREVLALADVADEVVVLGPQDVVDAYAEMLEALARRREEAAARRRREAEENDDQEDDADDRERAVWHIARRLAQPQN